jgi:hypothetical protein
MVFPISQENDSPQNHINRSCKQCGRDENQHALHDVRSHGPAARLLVGIQDSSDISDNLTLSLDISIYLQVDTKEVRRTDSAHNQWYQVPCSSPPELQYMQKRGYGEKNHKDNVGLLRRHESIKCPRCIFVVRIAIHGRYASFLFWMMTSKAEEVTKIENKQRKNRQID